jgi:tRNA-Thr(GGU) m(6)t(6)A37 methyltransferase TsaA
MALVSSDLKRLKAILAEGQALETKWPVGDCSSLRAQIEALESDAESEDLRRLSFHSRNLSPSMTTRHLVTILVPFERLLGKALRDDEILVTDTDRVEAPRATAPLTVVADNIRSAFNVGAIFRTSEAFGAEKVILTGYSSTPLEERTSKTSMGTENHIEWSQEASALETLQHLKNEGCKIIALETAENEETLGHFQWPEKCALILGNERFGIDHDVMALADHVVRIPLHGRKNSLNVGIALGVALADWRRQLASPARLQAIGVFHSPAVHPYEARRQGVANVMDEVATVELSRGRQFEQALKDLEGFERIWLIYDFHHNENWKPMVMPPRGPRVKRGVFATRSPYRPGGIGMSCVELVRIEGLQLFVKGFDLLDQTPILDIKPYLPYSDAFPQARAGWTEGLEDEAFHVELSARAARQLSWLRANGVDQLEGFVRSQLEYDPLDHERKRVRLQTNTVDPARYELSYRTWRIDFVIQSEAKQILVEGVRSGYLLDELRSSEDVYGDKTVHKHFIDQNFD